MDQTIAAHGRRGAALLFETAAGTLLPVPLPGRLWILETGVSHRLTGSAFNERRRECEEALAFCREWRPGLSYLAQLSPEDLPEVARRLPPPLVPRVRHVVTETARTRRAAEALGAGDLATLGQLLVEGHESLRRDYASTISEADFLVASAVAARSVWSPAHWRRLGWGSRSPGAARSRGTNRGRGRRRLSEAVWPHAGHLEHSGCPRGAARDGCRLNRYIPQPTPGWRNR